MVPCLMANKSAFLFSAKQNRDPRQKIGLEFLAWNSLSPLSSFPLGQLYLHSSVTDVATHADYETNMSSPYLLRENIT